MLRLCSYTIALLCSDRIIENVHEVGPPMMLYSYLTSAAFLLVKKKELVEEKGVLRGNHRSMIRICKRKTASDMIADLTHYFCIGFEPGGHNTER